MGNRATVTLKNDTLDRGIYVQWYGGAGSIAGLLRETKKRMGDSAMSLILSDDKDQDEFSKEYAVIDKENTITKFYATFFGAAREFFGYCTSYKSDTPLSIYIQVNVSGDGCDNGCYVIDDDFTCPRIDVDNFNEYERENYDMMEEFFTEVHHALSVIVEDEEIPYERKDDSADVIRQDIVSAKVIAEQAAARLARLEARLAEKVGAKSWEEKLAADAMAADTMAG